MQRDREETRTLLNHLLDSTRRVDLHCGEVIEAIDFGRLFREFLAEGIREIVCGIRGLKSKNEMGGCIERNWMWWRHVRSIAQIHELVRVG